jgi:hypothetical protein
MGGLRFVGAPPQRKGGPNRALLGAGLVILLAAAFGVGRLWTRPAAPPAAPAAVATARPAARASPPPAVVPTAPPRAAPTVAFQPREVFEIVRTPAPATPPPATAVTPAARAEPETLAKQIARCLTLTVSRDNMFTVTSGVRLLIKARNGCGQTFPGSEARFEVRAMAVNGAGFAGREHGSFQTSIQPFETVETVIVVPCDPDRAYRFEVEVR